jgi:hypothetical protein
MVYSLSLLNHFLDLFRRGKLSRDFDNSIHHQSRSNHHPVVTDCLDILHFYDFGLNGELFDRLFGSILELIALGSTHSQHFDFLHLLLLSINSVYEICHCP